MTSSATASSDLRPALEELASFRPRALKVIERNGFVFDSIGAEPGNWQHLAFTLYSMLCEADNIVRAALEPDE